MARQDKKIRIFSALEVANICGVVNQTAINWIKQGHLKFFKTPGEQYRVYADDLVDFLEARGMRIPEELQKIVEEQRSIDSVIIVDDDKELNNMMKEALISTNPKYIVHQAFDGFQAGKLSATHKPHLVLLDLDLPGIDGATLLRTLKEDETLGDPYIIVISGMAEKEKEVLEIGADAFMNKPIDLQDLNSTIEGLKRSRKK